MSREVNSFDPLDKPATKNDISGVSVAPRKQEAPPRNEISGTPHGHAPPRNVITGFDAKPVRPEDAIVTIYNHVTGEELQKRRTVANDYVRLRAKEGWSFDKPIDKSAIDKALVELGDKKPDAETQQLINVRLNGLRDEARALGIGVDVVWGIARLKREIDAKKAAMAAPLPPVVGEEPSRLTGDPSGADGANDAV